MLEVFGEKYGTFIEISGLAPSKGNSAKLQLENFAEQLALSFNIPGLTFQNWTQAFSALATYTQKGKYFILIDEISWMSFGDITFSGKLKIAWDKQFKNNHKLILALCGSVSSWIEDNILKDTDFVGRVSWQHNLGELDIESCSKFWADSNIAMKEKLKILSITGGIPKYLEEINISETAEQNIKRLCFNKTGYLFTDFNKIFNDVFNKRSTIYLNILHAIIDKNLPVKEIATLSSTEQNGDLTQYLTDLEVSGFIARDYTWDLKGKRGKLSHFRIKDNYLRFYLQYIHPNKDKIIKNLFEFTTIESLFNWDTIAGLQFENLILNNIGVVLKELNIPYESMIQYGSYFQTQTKARQATQIDLLILCKYNYLYLCELKFRQSIGLGVIEEVEEKVKRLKLPKHFSVRPILIYSGQLSQKLENSDYFLKRLNVDDLLH